MHTLIKYLLFIAALSGVSGPALATGTGVPVATANERTGVPAFPGAEGFGANTTGGRGGVTVHVTTLDDGPQPGTFRHACMMQGPRTIVFDVDGTIFLKDELRLESGDVTIAGQSAPGDGVCIADFPFLIQADNVIIRYMRFRLGDRHVDRHEGDGLGGSGHRNIIVDHCSVSWSIDECLSLLGHRDCTVQWCIATHSLNDSGHRKGPHGYGGNWGGSGVSYHHNLIANNCSRTPRLGPNPRTQCDERMDMRCNVIYNHGSNGCYGGEGMTLNIVNNYYKPGPQPNDNPCRIASPGIRTLTYCLNSVATANNYNRLTGNLLGRKDVSIRREGTPTDGKTLIRMGDREFEVDMEASTFEVDGKPVEVMWNVWRPMLHKWASIYAEGNANAADPAVLADNWGRGIYSQIDTVGNDGMWDARIRASLRRDNPFDCPPVTTQSADEAYRLVLAGVGASLHRDAYDAMVCADVADGSHTFGNNGIINSQDEIVYDDGTRGWPALAKGTPLPDTDRDGMPDEWELAHGLDPENAADAAVISDSGYSNLEIYLNGKLAPDF